MSDVYDGGPAFPEAGLSGLPNGEFIHGRAGMSLLAYFMAHAPAEPQTWFRPAMAGPAVPMPTPVRNMTDEERHEMDGWGEGAYDAPSLKQPRVRAYAMAAEERRKASAIYNQELERQRYLQWPAAWADAQLAILKGRP